MNIINNKIGIHQPNFFPWLGYFYKIFMSDKFVFLDNVQIELSSQQAYVNRTKIKSPQGSDWITCPVSKQLSLTREIKDTSFVQNVIWKKKIIKTLFLNYKKSNYFDENFVFFEELINTDIQLIGPYNINIIKSICTYIELDTPLYIASELNLQSSEKNNRIIEICKTLNSNFYLSGKGGTKYHDSNLFQSNNIQVIDLNFEHPVYSQLTPNFIQGLSIIDVLFNCGKTHTLSLIKNATVSS